MRGKDEFQRVWRIVRVPVVVWSSLAGRREFKLGRHGRMSVITVLVRSKAVTAWLERVAVPYPSIGPGRERKRMLYENGKPVVYGLVLPFPNVTITTQILPCLYMGRSVASSHT